MLFQPKRYRLLLERVEVAERRLAELAEQQRQLHETLLQRQAQVEQEVAALRATSASQMAAVHALVERQSSQHEALETALAEQRQVTLQVPHLLSTHTERQAETLQVQQREIEALLERHGRDSEEALQGIRQLVAADRVAWQQRLEQIEASLDQLAPHAQVQSLTQAWQQRTDTQQEQLAALRSQLQAEVQAREALAQQVATLRAQKTPKPPRNKPRQESTSTDEGQ